MKKESVTKNVEFALGLLAGVFLVLFVIVGVFQIANRNPNLGETTNAYFTLVGITEILGGLLAGVFGSFLMLPVFGLNVLEKHRRTILSLTFSGVFFLIFLLGIILDDYGYSNWANLILSMIAIGATIVYTVLKDKEFSPYIQIIGSVAMVSLSIVNLVGNFSGIHVVAFLSVLLIYVGFAVLAFLEKPGKEPMDDVKPVDGSKK